MLLLRQKISLFTFGVKDLQKSIKFYTALGWKPSAYSTGDLVVFSMGNTALCLYPRKKLAEDACIESSGSGFSGITVSFFARSTTEVDEVMAEVRKLDAEIAKPAQKAFWGGYSGYFKDPDGYLIEVAYNPFWPLEDDGSLKSPP